jgi:hypothetical protein
VRPVLAWYSPAIGLSPTMAANTRSRSAPASTVAVASNRSVPTSTVTAGWARRFRYQAGWAGAPPAEAMT